MGNFAHRVKNTSKRKHPSQIACTLRKRLRTEVDSIDDLTWKDISHPNASGFEGDDGFLEIEEVDNIEVIYEETDNGRIATFKVRGDDFRCHDG